VQGSVVVWYETFEQLFGIEGGRMELSAFIEFGGCVRHNVTGHGIQGADRKHTGHILLVIIS
jgi:hypothetical protein